MRRWLTTILILLLAGAAVNIAVAWGCAIWSEIKPSRPIERPRPIDLEWWDNHAWVYSDLPLVMVDDVRGFGFRATLMTAGAQELDSIEDDTGSTMLLRSGALPYDHMIRLVAGWPIENLSGEQWRTGITSPMFQFDFLSLAQQQMRFEASRVVWGISVVPNALGIQPLRLLPLRPMWPGSAVNTLFYAVLLWLLIPGPFALRRLIRRRRGLCPWCGYPMGDSAACSECGRPLPQRAVV